MENNKKSFKKNKTYMNAREMIATAEDIRNGGCGCGCGGDKTKKLTKKDIFVISKKNK
jgi:hypothetical protein